MDPITICAMAGLVYAGQKLSRNNTNKESMVYDSGDDPLPMIDAPRPDPPETKKDGQLPFGGTFNNIDLGINENRGRILSDFSGVYVADNPVAGVVPPRGEALLKLPSFGDISKDVSRNPQGQPVYDLYERANQNVSNTMNNLAPQQQQLVGPGLGVNASVPAFGGYQQVFRTLPNNVGGYKLTTLPGRSGPANATISGGKPALQGATFQNRPDKVYAYARRPPMAGRAQGQGGAVTGVTKRQEYEFTKRPTVRSETTSRNDGLEFGPALSMVPDPTVQERPTRNQGDMNTGVSYIAPAPGIHSFVGGYTSAPTNIRPADKRGKLDRQGNPGNMNVTANPLGAVGAITRVKDEACSNRIGCAAPTGANNQVYEQDMYYQLNAYKGNANFHNNSSGLNIAKKQLAKNPFAHTLSA